MSEEKTNKRKEFYQEFADKITAMIETNTAPWQRPWEAGEWQRPYNDVSKREYQGINAINLASQGYNDPRFLSFTQVQKENEEYKIRKGEHGHKIVFYEFFSKEPVLDEEGKPTFDENGNALKETVLLTKPIVKFYTVFNATQIEGMPLATPKEITWNASDRAEELLKNSQALIVHDRHDHAFYSIKDDIIRLPDKSQFPSSEAYYSTAIHELAHWTLAKDRAPRTDKEGIDTKTKYATEELRAEISAWLTCMELGLPFEPHQSVSYIESWSKAIKDDPFVIARACREAEHIKDFLMTFDPMAMEQKKEKEQIQTQTVERQIQNPEAKIHSPQLLSEKQVLYVPYKDRYEAKKLGAKWDNGAKSWFAPEGSDLNSFSPWVNPLQKMQEKPSCLSAEEEFAKVLKEAGFMLDSMPIMDGQLHRVQVQKEGISNKDGAYKGFLNGVPAGFYQNFHTGETSNWKYSMQELTPIEKEKLRTEAKETQEQAEKIRLAEQEHAAKRAFAIWKTSEWAKKHSYLERKDVKSYGIKIAENGNLLIPVRDTEGFIQSMQFITPEGDKYLLKNGKLAGGFHVIDPHKQFGTMPIIVAEGYATAVSLHEATNQPTICCFSSSNMLQVVKALREKYPKQEIHIMADNDINNPKLVGITKAKEAAKLVGNTKVFIPQFSEVEQKAGFTDYNDLARLHGNQIVLEQLEKQKNQKKSQEKKMSR